MMRILSTLLFTNGAQVKSLMQLVSADDCVLYDPLSLALIHAPYDCVLYDPLSLALIHAPYDLYGLNILA